MAHTEFVVVNKSSRTPTFFTSSSAYDRPRWVQIKEATKYTSDIAALNAVSKLRVKNILTAMTVMPLSEAIELVMPDQLTAINSADSLNGDEWSQQVDTDGGTTSVQSNIFAPVNPENDSAEVNYDDESEIDDDEESCDDDESEIDSSDEFDIEDEPTEIDGEDVSSVYNVVGSGADGNGIAMGTGPQAALVSLAMGMRESVNDLPVTETVEEVAARIRGDKKRFGKSMNGSREDNDTTAATSKIPFQKMFNKDFSNNEFVTIAASNGDDPVDVPTEVLVDLKKVIDEFDDCVNTGDGNVDRVSYCMTVADALRTVQGALEERTVSGIKQAQIKMSGFMNPITMMIPPSVVKFIASGGRLSSLKGLFDQKRSERTTK